MLAAVLWAQQQTAVIPSPQQPETIFVGQSLDQAVQALRTRKLEFVEGGLQIAYTGTNASDASNQLFTLDEEHVDASVFFSKSKKTVTGIQLICHPAQQQS